MMMQKNCENFITCFRNCSAFRNIFKGCVSADPTGLQRARQVLRKDEGAVTAREKKASVHEEDGSRDVLDNCLISALVCC